MPCVYVLGAGASRFAGYPLGLDLWPFVRDTSYREAFATKRATFVTTAMEQILLVMPPDEYDRPNLEELFTFLDLAARGAGPIELHRVDWPDVRVKLMGMIAAAFLWHEYQLQRELSSPGDPRNRILDAWARRVQPGDTIVTFNWDILHEAALWRRNKWHYGNGYGFACADAPPASLSPVRVLKLHGSVNWGQQDAQDCTPAIEHKADFFHGGTDAHETYLRAAGTWNEGRHLIIPTYLKDLSTNRLLVHLWNQASDALTTATSIVIIGFQLNPADALARYLLATTLLRNYLHPMITVVAPDADIDHWPKFFDDIGTHFRRDRRRFEDWVFQAAHP